MRSVTAVAAEIAGLDHKVGRLELTAREKPMALDTSSSASATAGPAVRLGTLRRKLLGRYPQTGPVFA